MSCLKTDLYQLTMAAGFWQAGKTRERATFELFVRNLPPNREFLVAAGLQQALEYLSCLEFKGPHIDYIRGLPQFAHVEPEFFEFLRAFRFTGDVWAVPEGTPLFAGEPFLTLRAPLLEAQIPETYLLSTVSFQSMIATKAVRVVRAAAGRSVVEFGARRAHSPEAGVLAGRAAYIGGCTGTSNVETGFLYGVPVFGTAAHSWVLAFADELESYRKLQQLLGDKTIYLIDTYDTLEGARMAGELGRPMFGVRLDSGNLIELAREVRKILDAAGLPEAKIMATGDLNEEKILAICQSGAPIDSFGVGTALATSSDSPTLSAVYKMVEIESNGVRRFVAKQSVHKHTLPGAKQIFRYQDRDVIGGCWECPSCKPMAEPSTALLRPMMLEGAILGKLPSVSESRDYCAHALEKIGPGHRIEFSPALLELAERLKGGEG